MKIVPEIELPDELEMAYRPDLRDWIYDNLEGLRRVNVQLYVKRNQYDNVAAIEFFEKSQKNTPKEKPKHDGKEISADDICELIMKIIQFDVESQDETNRKYRVQCVRNGGTASPILKAKHIDPPKSGDDEARFSSNPVDEEAGLVPTLMSYIRQLHEQSVADKSIITELIAPLMAQNAKLQDAVMKGFETRENIKRMEIVERLYEKEKETELEITRVKSESTKKNVDSLIKYAKDTGIAQQIIKGVMNKYGGGQQIPQDPPPPPSQNPPPPPPPEPEVDLDEENTKSEMKNAPLKTLSNGLYTSILDENQEDDLKKALGETLWKSLHTLMISSSEEEAHSNIQSVKEVWNSIGESDQIKIMSAMSNILNETQQKLVGIILEYIM